MSPTEQQIPQPTALTEPAAPPVFGQDPKGGKPKPKSMQPTFLGAGTSPQQSPMGGKTLLGQ